ncbi:MAG: fumarate/nitrate reduction transcriptional regulator Fnr [Pseudohongiella sp.]|nr:fumarate/nitrate reduction transcriptional regulator Fnr [Pseudohongiella sp.]MDO9521431.1 fumarate/nitrate reduction transcriptional regulator Fnr [Pseudohongiella sp.]MDP2126167.1 fumarate/nitrate reduction transcriptional regulator Fnr [Pseudohongiella sp.]
MSEVSIKTISGANGASVNSSAILASSVTVLNPRPCPHNPTVSCSSCRLSDLCLPIALNKSEIVQLDEIIERNRPLKKGEHLYRQRDEFRSVFAVRSGSFKSYVLGADGQSRVTGFFMPGEIIGMDGIGSRVHGVSTMALEHASICEIPFSQLEKLSHQLPNLQSRFFAIMSNEIVKDQQIHTLLSSYTAEQRLASFLLSLSARYARCQLSPERFLLHMTRSDIGEYLGLTLETVSRVFSALQKKEIILVKSREIEICDMHRLKAILGE